MPPEDRDIRAVKSIRRILRELPTPRDRKRVLGLLEDDLAPEYVPATRADGGHH